MADFDTIKHEIDANIPDNNVQYITAKKVRDTLNDMVDEINEAKQDTLVSGTNIKTVNGYTLLGEGNIEIEGGSIDLSSYVTKEYLQQQSYINSSELSNMSYITQTDLSNAGYLTSIPSEYITSDELAQASYVTESQLTTMSYITQSELDSMGYATATQLEGKQDTLVSGTNIKTINNESLLGSGNITIEGGYVDLSSYVTYDWLEAQSYVTEQTLSNMSYVTQTDLSNAGYLTSIPSEYITSDELAQASYVTESQLTSMSYITQTDLDGMGYITSSDLPDMSAYATLTYLKTYYATIESLSNSIGFVQDQLIEANILITDPETGDLTPDSMASQSYVEEYVSDHAPMPDLSAYVTKTELSGMSYVTQTALSGMGYLTSIPADYITQTDLDGMGYITSSDLPDMSAYATLTYLETYYATIESLSNSISFVQDQLIDANILITDPETGDLTPDSMASQSYVADYVATYAPEPDLSAYVTKTELNNAGYLTSIPNDYATYAAISEMGYLTSIPSEYVTSVELANASYVTQNELQSDLSQYVTEQALSQAGYITSIPNDYATYDAISQMGYITTIPSEYVTSDELAQASYATQSYVSDYVSQYAPQPDLTGYLLSPTISGYTGQMKLYNDGFWEVTSTGNLIAKSFTYNQLNSWNAYTIINRESLRNYVNGRLAEIEASYATQSDLSAYLSLSGGTLTGPTYFTYDTYLGGLPDVTAYLITQNDYNNLSTDDKNKELLYVISDQQPYQDNSLVTEASLSSKGYLTADNFIYDTYTGTLTINI